MSWQDELQQLDHALASGQISADDYRVRRDQLMAQASGQPPADPGQSNQGAEATQVFQPVPNQPQGGDPQGDRTQVVPPADHGSAEQTQAVQPYDPAADSTQVVPNVGPPQFPPPQQAPPWETGHPQQHYEQPMQQPAPAPPWANEDLPPEFGQTNWPRQGPEIFEESSGGNTGRIVAIVVAVLLVLGGGGAAIWYFVSQDDDGNGDGKQVAQTSDNPGPTEPTSEQPPEPPEPDIPEGPFMELPGAPVLNNTVPIEQAISEERPTKAEARLLESVGVSEVSSLVTEEDGEIRLGIWAFKAGKGAKATDVRKAMDQYYNDAGYKLESKKDGVFVRYLKTKTDAVYRTHYVADGGYMVRVEVYGKAKKAKAIKNRYSEVIADQIAAHPPVT